MKFFDQHLRNVTKGPLYEDEVAVPLSCPTHHDVRFIAYYLPQFHATEENNKFWGVGFTEWTNVTKAVPRFEGHYQPRLPSDLGFYDLASPDALSTQAALAKRGGIYGFCFHHYWFSGQEVLERPLQNLLQNKSIDMPFCLNWANENWTRRWDGADSEILLHQKYICGDAVRFAQSIVPALLDPRYIKVDGRPLMMIYRPKNIPKLQIFLDEMINELAANGIARPYLILPRISAGDNPKSLGFDAAAGFPPHFTNANLPSCRQQLHLFDRNYLGYVVPYNDVVSAGVKLLKDDPDTYPGVCPSWDNEARRPNRSFTVADSTPRSYGRWLHAAGRHALTFGESRRLVFINAWNEWAEGAYLEPDRHFGYAYLAETRRCLDALNEGSTVSPDDITSSLRLSPTNVIRSKYYSLLRRIKRLIPRRIPGQRPR